MKKLYFFTLLVCGMVQSQIVDIPDANFKAKLLSSGSGQNIAYNLAGSQFAIDANGDGELQLSEALQVKTLIIVNGNIASFEGINSFANLDGFQTNNNPVTVMEVGDLMHLEFLFVQSNELQSLDVHDLPVLEHIIGSENNLTSFTISNCPLLQQLELDDNNLTMLNLSGLPFLNNLKLSYNQLTALDVQGDSSLQTATLQYGNPIVSLDFTSCAAIMDIDISHTGVQSLNVAGCTLLETIQMGQSQTNTLDVTGCISLQDISASETMMEHLELHDLPALHFVNFSNNSALSTAMVSNCPVLTGFTADQSQISTFSISNCISLNVLGLPQNNLSSLEIQNCPAITILALESNQLTALDLSGQSHLNGIWVANNPLQYLNIKNGNIDSNTNLNNISLQYICADDNEIAPLQTILESNSISCFVSSYCSFTPGGNFNTVSGVATFDADSNGCEASDSQFPALTITVTDGSQSGSAITSATGSYSHYLGAGTFALAPSFENSQYFTASPPSVDVTFSDDNNNNTIQNFCIIPNGVHTDVEVLFAPLQAARPGFDAVYEIVFRNKGNQIQSGNIVLDFADSEIDYVSSSEIPAAQLTGSIEWNFSNLLPFESRSIQITFNINGPTETPAVNIGDELNFTAQINIASSDEMPADNMVTLKQIVVGSLDPNDMYCVEGNLAPTEKIGEFLHYIINFENTGTFPADRIVVADVLDSAQFDIESFQLMHTSHPAQLRITGNKAEFIFQNVNLNPSDHGFAAFKIKTKPTLVQGDSVSNKANIFFDYNFPIETNSANTTFSDLNRTSYSAPQASLYPNPAKNSISIKANDVLKSITIYDLQARPILSKDTADTANEVSADISALSSGTYFVKIKTANGESNLKFIKQ